MKKILLLVALFAGMTVYAADVTFNIDMSVWTKNGSFVPATDTVTVAGDFNGWSTNATVLTHGTGADSLVYSATYTGVTAANIAYKFIYINSKGVQWESVDNRTASITGTVSLPTVFFNNITGKNNSVKFVVDMSLPIKSGTFTIGTSTVNVAGDFNGWSTSSTVLTKTPADSTYSVYVDSLPSGSIAHFKFLYYSTPTSSATWEDGFATPSTNREYMVPQADSSEFKDYWNGKNPNVQLGTGKVNFTIDMSVMARCGIFNTVSDSVLISGGFNGWTTTDPTQILTQNPLNDSSYFISHQFTNEPFGAEFYKYVVKLDKAKNDTIWVDGYERPTHWGGGNRIALFAGETSRDTSDYYDNVHPDWFVPAGTNLVVNFTVDMTPAMDPILQAIPFDPAVDTLYWLSEEPAFARSQGWFRNNGHIRKIVMTKTTGNIYKGTINLKDPGFNAFEYRYEWIKGSDQSWITEPAGFDADNYRVRYVGQDVASHFPVNPWNMPQDIWTNSNIKAHEYDPYASLTGIKNESLAPASYSLSQNYPNPFNPSTTIKFSISKTDLVVMKIYNVLGQQVMTLVNEQLKPGTYSYKFDASKLSSGIYFYNINAGNFNQTKKMILIK